MTCGRMTLACNWLRLTTWSGYWPLIGLTGLPPVGGSAGTPKINGSNICVTGGAKNSLVFCFFKLIIVARLRPMLNSSKCSRSGNSDLFSREWKRLWWWNFGPISISEKRQFNQMMRFYRRRHRVVGFWNIFVKFKPWEMQTRPGRKGTATTASQTCAILLLCWQLGDWRHRLRQHQTGGAGTQGLRTNIIDTDGMNIWGVKLQSLLFNLSPGGDRSRWFRYRMKQF